MYTSQVSIAGKNYNLAHAPAKEQAHLVTLISGPLIRAKKSLELEGYTQQLISFMLMGSPYSLVEQVDSIVLKKAFVDGKKDIPVSVNSFQDEIQFYFDLLAHAILNNVGGFFERLREEDNLVSPSTEPNQTQK